MQFGGSGAASAVAQHQGPHDLEVLTELVELADSGCSVFWPPGLSLSEARSLLVASRLAPHVQSGQQPAAGAAVEEAEVVFSSQELEAVLESQLELEGWAKAWPDEGRPTVL